MTDGYDLFCFQQLTAAVQSTPHPSDEVIRACAKYLKDEGYGNVAHQITTNPLTS